MTEKQINPGVSLIFILLILVTGFFFIGPFLGLIFSLPFNNWDLLQTAQSLQDPINTPGSKPTMYVTQGFATFIGFILMPILYGRFYLRRSWSDLTGKYFPSPGLTLLTIGMVIIFMGVNSVLIDWNSKIQLPENSSFKIMVDELHNRYEELAGYLTGFESNYEIWAALLVIAILPAIGEELIFRGFIQQDLTKITKNAHVAIWLTAIFFGVFHLEFYGVIPRTVLGALFGYMFYWSGNIIFPMIGHFVNNAFTLLMLYFYRKGAINVDIESTESLPLTSVIISFLLSGVLIYIFRKKFKTKEESLTL